MKLQAIMKPTISLKREFDIPMSLPGNDDWDIYSTINEPTSPTKRPELQDVEDDGFNQWENNY